MMTSYFNLLKYAQTGQASPDMTYYDKMRASMLIGGGTVQTLTGQPPLSFKSNGTPLISWSMKGNGSQSGTPTPDNPIQPTFCGVRTAQLIDYTQSEQGGIDARGNLVPGDSLYRSTVFTPVDINLTTWAHYRSYLLRLYFYKSDKTFISRVEVPTQTDYQIQFPAETAYIKWTCYKASGIDINTLIYMEIMINTGSTALPYEPFGYKIPISCAGQTTPVYLGEVPTVRRVKKLVLTRESDVDNLFAYDGRIYVQNSGMLAETIVPFCNCLIGTDLPVASAPVNSVKQGRVNNQPFPAALVFKLDGITTTTGFLNFLSAMNSAGTPVTVWYVLEEPETAIVNEPIAKIGDYADELHSTDAAVTIPTAKGANTLTVDTELQPSEMSITYRG